MNCPCCRTKLVITGQQRLETTEEHVCDPNGTPCMKDAYECLKSDCPAFGQGMWESGGEYFCKDYKVKLPFIDDNSGPFGSFSRKLNVEIYKRDENFTICEVFGWKFKIVFNYLSNEDGDILKKRPKLEIWRKDAQLGGYILYTSGISMLRFRIKQFHKALRYHKEYGNGARLKEYLDSDEWMNKNQWWRILGCKYANFYMKIFGKGVLDNGSN